MSLLFYAWGEPKYIILMVLSIVINYYLAILIAKNKNKKKKKALLIFSIFINIGALFAFKYLDFLIYNVNFAFNFDLSPTGILLPIGISFYTFQILSYVIDVYREKVKVQKNIFNLGTYIALFPQLIAGPIVRYADIEKQLAHRTHSLAKFCNGLRRFMLGLAKKVLIANNVAIIADAVFVNPTLIDLSPGIIALGLISYTLQIYYDFSGYSDMAIGLGRMFGFDFCENFNYPYSAKSISDFWKRWHISLTTWFKDYLYIPLGGNRCSKIKWVRNFFIVWLCTGLWHGASWNYVLWGVFYAIILLFERKVFNKILSKLPNFLKWMYTFLIVNIGWLLFRVEGLSNINYVIRSIIKPTGTITEFLSNNYSITPYISFILVGLIFMFPVCKKTRFIASKNQFFGIILDLVIISLFIISIFALITSSYNPFIYFRF